MFCEHNVLRTPTRSEFRPNVMRSFLLHINTSGQWMCRLKCFFFLLSFSPSKQRYSGHISCKWHSSPVETYYVILAVVFHDFLVQYTFLGDTYVQIHYWHNGCPQEVSQREHSLSIFGSYRKVMRRITTECVRIVRINWKQSFTDPSLSLKVGGQTRYGIKTYMTTLKLSENKKCLLTSS